VQKRLERLKPDAPSRTFFHHRPLSSIKQRIRIMKSDCF
jgi:hypothetical protein